MATKQRNAKRKASGTKRSAARKVSQRAPRPMAAMRGNHNETLLREAVGA